MNFDFILGKFEHVKRNSNGSYNVSCPLQAHKHGDKRPSLTITEQEDRIDLYCFVCGKVAKEVFQEIGIEEKYLFKANWNKEEYSARPTPGNNGKSYSIEDIRDFMKVTKEYPYYDKDCNLRAYKARHRKNGEEEKGLWYHPTGNNRYKYKQGTDDPLFYGLPDVIKAKEKGIKTYFFPEGEKDSDTISEMGLPAFTSGGANSFKDEHAQVICNLLDNSEYNIVILYDNDPAGIKLKDDKIRLLLKHNFKGKIIIPDLPKEKKDITDWKEAGHTKEEFIELVKQTPQYSPPVTEKKEEALTTITGFNYNSAIEQDNKIEDNWIVENLFARGVNFSVLFGEPGVCKTWLILSEFLKLADGKNIFGKYETEPKKTVLLEADFPSNVFEYRLKRLYRPENIDNFIMYSADKIQEAGLEYCMDTEKGRETIESLMEKEKPDILIIDSLGSWIQGDEVKQDVIKPVIEFLKHISHKFNLHILLIHHPRKRSNVERLNRLLDMSDATGSFLLARYASSIYTVNGLYDEEGRVENKGLVINVKNWFKTSPKFEFSMEQNEDEKMEFTFEYKDLTSFKDKKIGTKEAVIENLKNNPEGLTKKQFIKLIPNVSLATIERALRELKKQKEITSIGNTSNLIYKLYSDTQDNEGSIEKEYTPQGKELPSPLKGDEGSQNVKKEKKGLSVSPFISLHPCREFNPIQDKGKDTTPFITCVSEKIKKCSNCEHGSGSSPAGYHICKISPDRSYPGQVEHDCIDYTAIDCIKEHKQRYNEALRNLTAGIDPVNCKDVMRETIGNLKAMGINATGEEIQRGFELCRT
jgi:Mg2+ and Co2+ transporter CorA